MPNERKRQIPPTQTSAPVEHSRPKDVRDEKQMPREAGADRDAEPRRGSVDPRETLGE